MVSLEPKQQDVVEFYDEQENPVYHQKQTSFQEFSAQLNTLEIFNQESPNLADWEDLHKADASLKAALFQIQSVIDMVEMCRPSEAKSNSIGKLVGRMGTRQFFSVKHLVKHKSTPINWLERIALKYKALTDCENIMEDKIRSIEENQDRQRVFIHNLLEIRKKWKILREGNSVYALIWNGKMKNLVGDIHKAFLFIDKQEGFKVQLHPEVKKLKFLHVVMKSNNLSLPALNLFKSDIINEDLFKAEEVVKDFALMKTIFNEIEDTNLYNVRKFNEKNIEIRVNTEVKGISLTLQFEMKDELQESSTEKTILDNLFEKFIIKKERNGKLLAKFINILVHNSVKLEAYGILVKALEKNEINYRIQTKSSEELNTTYIVFNEIGNNKIIDLNINESKLRCSTYQQLYINRFIPLRPIMEVKLCELESLLSTTINYQKEIMCQDFH